VEASALVDGRATALPPFGDMDKSSVRHLTLSLRFCAAQRARGRSVTARG
jgi:hypothetical protein